jgi:hypothetical protein
VYYDSLYRTKIIKDKDLNVVKKYTYEDNLLYITTTPNWQNTGVTQCDHIIVGNVNRQVKDLNLWSDTYNSTKFIYDHNDCATCPPPCIQGANKIIGCNCEAGIRTNLSSHTSGTSYLCTYAYCFSDGTMSLQHTELLSSPCTVQGPCVIQ